MRAPARARGTLDASPTFPFSCSPDTVYNNLAAMLSEKPWRPDEVIFFCGSQLMCLCLGAVIIGVLDKVGVTAFKLPDGFGAVVVSTLSFQGATWGLIAFFLWQKDVDWRDFFGLRNSRWARALGWAILAVVILLPVLGELQALFASLLTRLGHPPGKEMAVQLVENTKSLWSRVYMGVFAVVLAPVAEEFIFRGMLFPFIRQLGYLRLAWLGVSALFALIHWDGATFVPLFVLALALTWLYVKTGNLLAPIAAHALFNAVNFAVLMTGDQAPVQ
jgi:membrane protease YdiL (CAAX protease family)